MQLIAVVTPLLRSYAIMASSISDRPRAIAEIIGARALGVAIGPSFLNNFLDCYNLEIRSLHFQNFWVLIVCLQKVFARFLMFLNFQKVPKSVR